MKNFKLIFYDRESWPLVLKRLIFSLFFLWIPNVWANISFPGQLSAEDQGAILSILGQGTSNKLLSSPYSLGGHSGLEVGLSADILSTSDFSNYGDHSITKKNEFIIPKITIGKGLFHNIDLFFNFTPFIESQGTSHYGGMVKWMFWNSMDSQNYARSPLLSATYSFSLLGHMSGMNFANQVSTQTNGLALLLGLNFSDLSFYAGLGQLYLWGRFMNQITLTGKNEKLTQSPFYTFWGVNYQIWNYFAAFELNHTDQTVFSFKLGTRF